MIGAIILQVILIALNAVFTCAETAIVSLNDNQLEEMAKKDEAKAALLSGFKAKLKKDTSYKGLWTVSFTLNEM